MIDKLKNRKLKVTLRPNMQVTVKYGTKAYEVLNALDTDMSNVLGVRVNNSVRNLDYELVADTLLETVNFDSADGYRIYIRTVKFILYMALRRLYNDLDIEVCNTIGGTIYFICKNKEFTELMAEEILKEMRSIVSNNSSFKRCVVTYEEAKYLFEQSKDVEALDSINVKMSSYITLYTCENMYGLTDGILAPSAEYTKDFNIKKFRRGFALLVPKQNDITKIEKKVTENPLYKVFEDEEDFLDNINVRSVNELNNIIITGKTKEIVRICEAKHANKMAELIADVKKKGRKRLFLIAGPSSSGKTTFAGKLCTNLKLIGYNPIVISMDNYFKERVDTPKQANGEYDFETIDALDMKLFNSHMKKLFNGETVEIPDFNFLTGEKEYRGNVLKLEERDCLVLEGIHALNPELLKDIDDGLKYKIYIAPMTTLNIDDFSKVSTTDTRMLRRIVRDYYTRGHRVDKTLSMWSNLMRGESKYIYPYIACADYIYNTSLAYEIGALRTFAEPLLLQIDPTNEYFSEARRLYTFIQKFLPTETSEIPTNSIIREFIGNASLKI